MKWAILVCCLSVKWPRLITVHYPSARCHNKAAGSLAVALSLSSLKKQRCIVLLAVSSGQLPILSSMETNEELRSLAITNPSENETHVMNMTFSVTFNTESCIGGPFLGGRMWSAITFGDNAYVSVCNTFCKSVHLGCAVCWKLVKHLNSKLKTLKKFGKTVVKQT